MTTQRKDVLFPFPSSDNSHNTHNLHNLPPPDQWAMIGWEKVKYAERPFLSSSVFFLTFLVLHGVQNLGILELWRINWREKRHGCFKEACVFNRVPVLWILMFPPAWGLWNGAYLCAWYDLLHELTLKCFPGSFWGFLAWLSVTMHTGICINAIYAMFPFSLSLSFSSFPSPPAWAHFPLFSSSVFYWELWRL